MLLKCGKFLGGIQRCIYNSRALPVEHLFASRLLAMGLLLQGDNVETASIPCITSDRAIGVFGRILSLLNTGPRCPCGLASEVGMREREIYPYLAELLARRWISALTDSSFVPTGEFEPRNSKSDEQGLRRSELDSRIADCCRQQASLDIAPSEEDKIQQTTLLWYDLFRAMEEIPLQVRPVLYVALTRAGREVASIL